MALSESQVNQSISMDRAIYAGIADQLTKTRRLRFIALSTFDIIELIRSSTPEFVYFPDGLCYPSDMHVVGSEALINMDEQTVKEIRLIVHSEEFSPVPEGEPIPEFMDGHIKKHLWVRKPATDTHEKRAIQTDPTGST